MKFLILTFLLITSLGLTSQAQTALEFDCQTAVDKIDELIDQTRISTQVVVEHLNAEAVGYDGVAVLMLKLGDLAQSGQPINPATAPVFRAQSKNATDMAVKTRDIAKGADEQQKSLRAFFRNIQRCLLK